MLKYDFESTFCNPDKKKWCSQFYSLFVTLSICTHM